MDSGTNSPTSELKPDYRRLKAITEHELTANIVTNVLRPSYEKSCPITYPEKKSQPVW